MSQDENPIRYFDNRLQKEAVKLLPGQYYATASDKALGLRRQPRAGTLWADHQREGCGLAVCLESGPAGNAGATKPFCKITATSVSLA